MLRSINATKRFVLQASDGEIGRCKNFLFNDEDWVVRYMVADTGKWLPGRTVLISPISLGEPDWTSSRFPVALSRDEVKNAPDIPDDGPVSRQHEAEFLTRMGYMPYWGGAGVWGGFATPGHLRSHGSFASSWLA